MGLGKEQEHLHLKMVPEVEGEPGARLAAVAAAVGEAAAAAVAVPGLGDASVLFHEDKYTDVN